ncbi:Protein of unknown function [Gryllus bimaculatus]|nr:Protein of unknown function [Gryllus bimaculatus]
MASFHRPMLLVGILLCLACSLSLTKLLLCVFAEGSPGTGDKSEVDIWLEENELRQYKSIFKEHGMNECCVAFGRGPKDVYRNIGNTAEDTAFYERKLRTRKLGLQKKKGFSSLAITDWPGTEPGLSCGRRMRLPVRHKQPRTVDVDPSVGGAGRGEVNGLEAGGVDNAGSLDAAGAGAGAARRGAGPGRAAWGAAACMLNAPSHQQGLVHPSKAAKLLAQGDENGGCTGLTSCGVVKRRGGVSANQYRVAAGMGISLGDGYQEAEIQGPQSLYTFVICLVRKLVYMKGRVW